MFKVDNEDTRTTPMASGVFIVNFEHVISGKVAFHSEKQNVHWSLFSLTLSHPWHLNQMKVKNAC